jgi:hypothetical protein
VGVGSAWRPQERKRTAYEAKQIVEKERREAEEAQRREAAVQHAAAAAAAAEAEAEAAAARSEAEGGGRVADARSEEARAEVQALQQQGAAAFPLVLELPALHAWGTGEEQSLGARDDAAREKAEEGVGENAEDREEGEQLRSPIER